jgi:hypothetical protein
MRRKWRMLLPTPPKTGRYDRIKDESNVCRYPRSSASASFCKLTGILPLQTTYI